MKIPEKSFLMGGVRYIRMNIDIMLNRGEKYYATYRGNVRMHADLALGEYIVLYEDVTAAVLERFPSLNDRKEYTLMLGNVGIRERQTNKPVRV